MRILAFIRLISCCAFIVGIAQGAALDGNKITADGTYTVSTTPGTRYSFAVSGTFGSGSLAVNWNDGSGSGAYTGSPATTAESWIFTAATSQVDLVLSGATNPSLTITLTPSTGNSGTVTSQDIAAALGYTPATVLPGVRVTHKDGSVETFAPTADTDTARGVALAAAFADSDTIAGTTVDLAPGDYLVAKAPTTIAGAPVQFQILNGMTVRLNGARLYHTATENTYVMFIGGMGSTTVHNWSLIGPGILEGTDLASPWTSTGEIGLMVGGGGGRTFNYRVENVTFQGFATEGLSFYNPTYSVGMLKVGGMTRGCTFQYNNVGCAAYQAAEFLQFSTCAFNYNGTGMYLDAGNATFVGCKALGNVTYGLRILATSNPGHGNWIGGFINHNYGFGVHVAAGLTLGFTFDGCHFGGADGTTLNKLQLNGYGINITGGELDSPIYTTAVNSGLNVLDGVRITANPTTILTNLFAGSRVKLKIKNCYTMTALWDQNDIFTTYVDDAAAGTGGVLAGEIWHQTTTGAVFVKQ